MKKIVLLHLMFLLILLISCKNQNKNTNSNWDRFKHFIETDYSISFENYDYICLLSDKGCLHCNKRLSKILPHVFERDDFLIIISETGGYLDLRNYSFEEENIVHTYKDIYSPFFEINGSYFGELYSGNCDSLYLIDANSTDSILSIIMTISDKKHLTENL